LFENHTQAWNAPLDHHTLKWPRSTWKKMALIWRLFFKKRYQMVQLAGWGMPICVFFIMLAKIMRMPIVIETDTPLPYRIAFYKKLIKRIIYPRLFRAVNLFLTGGSRQIKYLQYYNVPDHRIRSVQMTVDVASIRKQIRSFTAEDKQVIRDRHQIAKDSVIFLFVGRLETIKGLAELLDIFKQYQHNTMTLLVVGDGSMRPDVMQAAQESANIIYMGRLEHQALLLTYYVADVLVLPSHTEPWGLVVNEAMAVGMPVIVSDRVGCIDDLVIHQQTGLIYPSGNREALQSAIETVAASPSMRSAMRHHALERIDPWTLENEAIKTCQAWQQLLSV
jgi:glycosyltransferase involved in cell wall biosynthesis